MKDPLSHLLRIQPLADIIVVGAGAAGLATTIFCGGRIGHGRCSRRRRPRAAPESSSAADSVQRHEPRHLQGANLWGGRRPLHGILHRFSPDATVRFFRELGGVTYMKRRAANCSPTAAGRATCSTPPRGVDAAAVSCSPIAVSSISSQTGAGFRLEHRRWGTSLPLPGAGHQSAITQNRQRWSRDALGRQTRSYDCADYAALAPLMLDQASEEAFNRALTGVSHQQLTISSTDDRRPGTKPAMEKKKKKKKS